MRALDSPTSCRNQKANYKQKQEQLIRRKTLRRSVLRNLNLMTTNYRMMNQIKCLALTMREKQTKNLRKTL